jgi:hypothetical protein
MHDLTVPDLQNRILLVAYQLWNFYYFIVLVPTSQYTGDDDTVTHRGNM